MIKRRPLIISLALAVLVLGALAYFFKKKTAQPLPAAANALPKNINAPKVEVNGRKVIGLTPGKENEEARTLAVENIVSPEWRENVEEALRAQGGDKLKAVEITKLDSFIWSHHGTAINVESILISVTNQKDERTKFKALVDSQSGKILQTWDHPVIDTINPRENPGVKIDPRYLQ